MHWGAELVQVFFQCLSGCWLLPHGDSLIHWAGCLLLPPADGWIQVQLKSIEESLFLKLFSGWPLRPLRLVCDRLNCCVLLCLLFCLILVPLQAKLALRTDGQCIQRERKVWGERRTSSLLFGVRSSWQCPSRYFMDVPHHWEGWVVGEELGSLSNNGDADCPVDIPVLSRAFCYLMSDRHPWHLGGTWQVGMSGKRIPRSQ